MRAHGQRNQSNTLQRIQQRDISRLQGRNLPVATRILIPNSNRATPLDSPQQQLRSEVSGNASASNDLFSGRAASNRVINHIRESDIYTKDTLLIDIDLKHYGIFAGIAPSITFIPGKFIRKIRKLYIKYFQLCIDDPTDTHYKKFLLLPLVLYDNLDMNNKPLRDKTIARRIELLEKNDQGDWYSFSIGSLSKKVIRSDNYTKDQVIAAVSRLAKAGEIGKAYRKLNADTRKVIPNEEILERLKSKFPKAGTNDLSEQQVRSLFQYDPERDHDFEPIKATELHVESVIFKSKNFTAHGFDHTRYEHVKQLWSSEANDPNKAEFRKLFTAFINLIISGNIPAAVLAMFQDIELCALPKSDNDVRPIGLQHVYRKIASSVCLYQTKEFNETHFEHLQYCMKKSGAETIAHSFKAVMEVQPTWDIFCKDGENGFGNMNKMCALFETKENFPSLFPFARAMYGTASNAWYMGLPTGIESILCEEGCQQGDVLSMWLYAMAIQPFIVGIRNILGNEGFTKWFADDGNSAAPFDTMCEVIEYIIREGPKVGYFMKLTKGTYLLGKCVSLEEAEARKARLVNLGLHEDMIIIHPDNLPENSHLYGCKVVGTWIGTDEYIVKNLREKMVSLRAEAELLKAFPDPQVQNLMLRWCFSQKITYLLRSTSPHLMEDFIWKFDVLKQEILASIIQCPIHWLDESLWSQCCLNINDGGLGLQASSDVSHAAYIASIVECSDTLLHLFPTILNSDIPMINALHTSLNRSSNIQGRDTNMTMEEVVTMAAELKNTKSTLQNTISDLQSKNTKKLFLEAITDTKRIAWITSITDSTSGRWLEVSPKAKHQVFSSAEFRTALRHRMFLPHQFFIPGSKCNCKRKSNLDPLGHHISTGCNKDGSLLNTHDSLSYCFKDFLNHAGIMARMEELGCFRGSDPNCNKKPDLSLFNYPNCLKQKLILDLSLAHPVPILGSVELSRNQAILPNRAGNKRVHEKRIKYQQIADANNLEFLPIIFETTGRMHPLTAKFFDDTIEYMAYSQVQSNIMKSVSSLYWSARISCCIQKSIANSILSRSRSINGNLTREIGVEYAREFMETFRLNT